MLHHAHRVCTHPTPANFYIHFPRGQRRQGCREDRENICTHWSQSGCLANTSAWCIVKYLELQWFRVPSVGLPICCSMGYNGHPLPSEHLRNDVLSSLFVHPDWAQWDWRLTSLRPAAGTPRMCTRVSDAPVPVPAVCGGCGDPRRHRLESVSMVAAGGCVP